MIFTLIITIFLYITFVVHISAIMKKLLIVSFLLFSYSAFAQKTIPDYLVSETYVQSLWTLDLLFSPGITYEKPLDQINTLVILANVGHAFRIQPDDGGPYSNFVNTGWMTKPRFKMQYRNYYNAEKRAYLNKKSAYNSSDYIAVNVEYISRSLYQSNELLYDPFVGLVVGPMWGIQRNGTMTFDFGLGPGVYIGNESNIYFGILFDLRMGINLTKVFGKS